MAELSAQLQDASQRKECPSSIPGLCSYKNRLQEYTQKSSIHLPVYHTVNEGTPHGPRFRSKVSVDGKEFASQKTFLARKAAEQDVAKIALDSIFQETKDDIYPFIHLDTSFCKSILYEYAVKMSLEGPTYTTEQSKEVIPVFASEVTFNGVKLKGETARNKKAAEQSAARAAILFVLDSGSRTAMSEIIKSKSKFYAALNKAKDVSNIQIDTVPMSQGISGDICVPANKRKDIESTSENAIAANLPAIGASVAQSADAQVVSLPFHEFKKPKTESPSEVMTPPIIFVPPISGESAPCSTSEKERICKNKEDIAGEHGVHVNTQLPIAVTPLSQVPPAQ